MTTVIIGAGQAGTQTAFSLRASGYQGEIVLLGEEAIAPYQRPPLSKSYLKSLIKEELDLAGMMDIQPAAGYDRHRIDLRIGIRVESIDRDRHVVVTSRGELSYDHLVLATGASARRLPGLPDTCLGLRTMADVERLALQVRGVRRAVVVGGGFIGMEAASVLGEVGIETDVIELADRVMARGLSQPMASHLEHLHTDNGVRIHTSTGFEHLGVGARGVTVQAGSTRLEEVDVVVLGLGVTPRVSLAEEAGLAVGDGIEVDSSLRTSDPHIYAIGDVASFPSPYATVARTRLESVQNATDQAKHVAAQVAKGGHSPYSSVPWFWTEQWGKRVQMAGIINGEDELFVRDEADGLSVLAFRSGVLAAVESLGRPAEHMAARRLLADLAAAPTKVEVEAVDGDLTELARRRRSSTTAEAGSGRTR